MPSTPVDQVVEQHGRKERKGSQWGVFGYDPKKGGRTSNESPLSRTRRLATKISNASGGSDKVRDLESVKIERGPPPKGMKLNRQDSTEVHAEEDKRTFQEKFTTCYFPFTLLFITFIQLFFTPFLLAVPYPEGMRNGLGDVLKYTVRCHPLSFSLVLSLSLSLSLFLSLPFSLSLSLSPFLCSLCRSLPLLSPL